VNGAAAVFKRHVSLRLRTLDFDHRIAALKTSRQVLKEIDKCVSARHPSPLCQWYSPGRSTTHQHHHTTDGRHSMAAKKKSRKPAAKKKAAAKRKPNAAFMKPMQPSATLAAVIGGSAMPRTEVTKKIWNYIKRNDLQDSKNRRMINADDKLRDLFGGKKQVSMFEMTKLVSKHLK
jgi:upstream activation factor subunit UAF30